MTPMLETNSLQRIASMHPLHYTQGDGIAAPSGHWSSLWFRLIRHRWTSLVFVPAERRGSAIEIASALAEFGRPFQKEPIYVLNSAHMTPGDVPAIVDALQDGAASGVRVLVAINSPLVQHAAIPIARAADAAVLVVRLGRAEIRTARRTIEAIGPASFVGSIAV